MPVYSTETGEFAVKAARAIIENACGGPAPSVSYPSLFEKNAGVFVTINTYPSLNLRGCIGYPEPVFPLREALVKAAQGATQDPRFDPLSTEELDKIVVEVSVLTPPVLLKVKKPKEYFDKVKIGRDGLIAAKGGLKGLLLPQVPIEWKWNVEEFLSNTCMKAGLPHDAWSNPGTEIYSFQAEIFSEEEPKGMIVRRVLGGEG